MASAQKGETPISMSKGAQMATGTPKPVMPCKNAAKA